MEDLIRVLLGKQKVWQATITRGDDGVAMLNVCRTDGQFYEIKLNTDGYDRPEIINYGIGKTSVVLNKDGCVATEPEVITHPNGSKETQDRIIRASADNPKYGDVPKGIVSGSNMLDSQRVKYRDGAVWSMVGATEVPPTRETKDGFVPCKMVPLSGMGNYDAPGKAAMMDAVLTLLTEDELAELGRKLYTRAVEKSR